MNFELVRTTILKTDKEILEIAVQTIRDEGTAIHGLLQLLDSAFTETVKLILNNKGRVIVTGIGKSAIIAGKLVSTLNSTGTQAVFLHAADAVHGDLGVVGSEDIVICLSKSGESPEIKVIIPLLKLLGNKLIAMVGNRRSFLAQEADLVLDVSVEKEACPNNLAPTSSTTAQLVMCDALAVALLECRGFTSQDFARYHPGGALGKRLYLKVDDLYKSNQKPEVDIDSELKEIILKVSSGRLGCTAVIDKDRKLAGIITDGDLRRMLQNRNDLSGVTAADIMSVNPRTLPSDTLVSDALDMMRQNNITQVLVVDEGIYKGVVHLHDILKEGII